MLKVFSILIALLSTSVAAQSISLEEKLGDYRVLSISSSDELSVVKSKSGQMITVHIGDVLTDAPAKVIKILSDRLVLSDPERPGDVFYLYLADKNNDSRVQRIKSDMSEELKQAPPELHKVNLTEGSQ